MQTVKVQLGRRSYAIEVRAGGLDSVGNRTRTALGDKPETAVIISNPTVNEKYGRRVRSSLARAGFRVKNLIIGDGERYKTLKTAESIYTWLINNRIERKDVIVALGGGVIGDVAGFAAATYLRGLNLVHVPTTLLAQIDSSIGGKTGVNHKLGKNLIGSFYQPALVMTDPEVLETLPAREMNSGLFEALKYGIIRDSALFHRLVSNIQLVKRGDVDELIYLIAACCQIKADVVREDERESGLRRILNFGHTVGHALEAVTNYRRFRHGEAVGHGMRSAARIAQIIGLLRADYGQAISSAVSEVGRLPSARNIASRDIILAMMRDKKTEAGNIAFVLPVEIGSVVVRSDVGLVAIRQALKESLI
jgi:3-dehydroquinate synthase